MTAIKGTAQNNFHSYIFILSRILESLDIKTILPLLRPSNKLNIQSSVSSQISWTKSGFPSLLCILSVHLLIDLLSVGFKPGVQPLGQDVAVSLGVTL